MSYIFLTVDGRELHVPRSLKPSTRLIDVLRFEVGSKGPKLGCGEGGCGACAVLVERKDPVTGTVSVSTINSCLAPVASLHGATITTSEGLGNSKRGFNVVQEAIAKRNASQCGFCTPGIVVACEAVRRKAGAASASGGTCTASCSARVTQATVTGAPGVEQYMKGLDGNLCRCTGWRPIVDVCRDLADLEDLCTKPPAEPQHKPLYPARRPQVHKVHNKQQQAHDQQQQQLEEVVGPLQFAGGEGGGGGGSDRQLWFSPTSVDELLQLMRKYERDKPRLVAGNTGAGVYKDWPLDPVIISTRDVEEMRVIKAISNKSSHEPDTTTTSTITMPPPPSSQSSTPSSAAAAGIPAVTGPQDVQKAACCNSSTSSSGSCGCGDKALLLGGSVTLEELIGVLRSGAGTGAEAGPCRSSGSNNVSSCSCCCGGGADMLNAMADHLERIAGVHVRSAATLGGHFALARTRPLPSDVATVLAAAGAQLHITSPEGHQHWLTVEDYLHTGGVTSVTNDSGVLVTPGDTAGTDAVDGRSDRAMVVGYEARINTAITGSSSSRRSSLSTSCGSEEFLLTDADVAGLQGYVPLLDGAAAAGAALEPPRNEGEDDDNDEGLVLAAADVAGAWHATAAVAAPNTGLAAAAAVVAPEPRGEAASRAAAVSACRGVHVVRAVLLPLPSSRERFWSHKVALRYANSHALVNMAVWMKTKEDTEPLPTTWEGAALGTTTTTTITSSSSSGNAPTTSSSSSFGGSTGAKCTAAGGGKCTAAGVTVEAVRVVLGFPGGDGGDDGSSWYCVRARGVEEVLRAGQEGLDVKVVLAALQALNLHLTQDFNLPADSYTAQTLEGLLFSALTRLLPPNTPKTLNPALQRLLSYPGPYGPPGVPEGTQTYQDMSGLGRAPVHLPVEKEGVRLQASGEAEYVSDVLVGSGAKVLHAAVVKSSQALAQIISIDPSPALTLTGVSAFLSAADIPSSGTNEVYGAPLFATDLVEYVGQPIGIILAHSPDLAEYAATRVSVTYGPPPDGRKPVITIQDAIAAGSWYEDPYGIGHKLKRGFGGDVSAAVAAAEHKIEGGCYSLPAQQHMYMETQVAVAVPGEERGLTVYSSTQSLDAVQKAVAEVVGVGYHQVNVVTKRLGGGFGGKASRSMPVAAAAALATHQLGHPVRLSLNRNDDMRLNAGRCYGEVMYDVGFDGSGKISAMDVKVIFRAGAYLDLASNDGFTLALALDNAYDLSAFRRDIRIARCNLPPHTIMRAPGFLQGAMVLEQITEHVAGYLGLDPADVKQQNFPPTLTRSPGGSGTIGPSSRANTNPALHDSNAVAVAVAAAAAAASINTSSSSRRSEGRNIEGGSGRKGGGGGGGGRGAVYDSGFEKRPCMGMEGGHQETARVTGSAGPAANATSAGAGGGGSNEDELYTLPRVWATLRQGCKYDERRAEVEEFNRNNMWRKRGIAITPVRFDCAPAAISAAISVYADGTLLLTHGGIEMGQGLATKVKQAAAYQLGLLLPPAQRPFPLDLIKLGPSSSAVVPNGGPTWSSTGSEASCQAVRLAADKIVTRLEPYVEGCTGPNGLSTWRSTVASVYSEVGFAPSGVCLSAYGFFDGTMGKDQCPVSYSSFGAAVSEVEVDVLTGERQLLRTDICYDCGYSINPGLDIGQVEGAFVQGIGVMCSEEVVVNPSTGHLMSDSTWSYKIPTPDLIPQQFNVHFLEGAPNPRGIMSSKASGEPALMAAASVVMAIQQAAAAARLDIQDVMSTAPAAAATAAGTAAITAAVTDTTTATASTSSSPTPAAAAAVGAAGPAGSFLVLPAPATPPRIKSVVGSFSVADMILKAMGQTRLLLPPPPPAAAAAAGAGDSRSGLRRANDTTATAVAVAGQHEALGVEEQSKGVTEYAAAAGTVASDAAAAGGVGGLKVGRAGGEVEVGGRAAGGGGGAKEAGWVVL